MIALTRPSREERHGFLLCPRDGIVASAITEAHRVLRDLIPKDEFEAKVYPPSLT